MLFNISLCVSRPNIFPIEYKYRYSHTHSHRETATRCSSLCFPMFGFPMLMMMLVAILYEEYIYTANLSSARQEIINVHQIYM